MHTKDDPMISRRSFLRTGAAGLAATGLGPALLGAAEKGSGKKIPIGLQLYSVRHQAARDLKGVLEAVAKMGYQGVEFAGYYGKKDTDIRKMLDANSLVCCGTHTGLGTLMGEELKKTIAWNKTLDNKFLIVPGLPHTRTRSRKAWLETAKLFNDIEARAKEHGMRVGYHAHGGDFKKFGGQTGWDLFFSNVKPTVVMQLDTGNCIGGGGDPVAVLKKFPGRATTIHLKEHGGAKDAVIGEGDCPWEKIFKLCEAGGTEWYIVEHERGGADPLDDVRRCLKNLRKMGK